MLLDMLVVSIQTIQLSTALSQAEQDLKLRKCNADNEKRARG